MSNIQELETAVAQLSADELGQFSQWFEKFMANQNAPAAKDDFFNCAGIWRNRDDITQTAIRTLAWRENKE